MGVRKKVSQKNLWQFFFFLFCFEVGFACANLGDLSTYTQFQIIFGCILFSNVIFLIAALSLKESDKFIFETQDVLERERANSTFQ